MRVASPGRRKGITMKLFPTISCSLTLAACVAGDAPEAAPDQPSYTRTVVRIANDGSRSVTQEVVTQSQQAAEVAQAHRDPGDRRIGYPVADAIERVDCSNFLTATKLFDQPNYTGNELCFLGDTPQDGDYELLGNFCRLFIRGPGGRLVCARTWQGAIQSLWTGQAVVVVENNGSGAGYCYDYLPEAEAQATPTACDAQAFDLRINLFEL
jgi:hypothetical protein